MYKLTWQVPRRFLNVTLYNMRRFVYSIQLEVQFKVVVLYLNNETLGPRNDVIAEPRSTRGHLSDHSWSA